MRGAPGLRFRETSEDGVYKVAIEYIEEELGRAALETGHRLCLAAVNDLPFDMQAEIARLREVYHRVALGPSTKAIVLRMSDFMRLPRKDFELSSRRRTV